MSHHIVQAEDVHYSYPDGTAGLAGVTQPRDVLTSGTGRVRWTCPINALTGATPLIRKASTLERKKNMYPRLKGKALYQAIDEIHKKTGFQYDSEQKPEYCPEEVCIMVDHVLTVATGPG